MSVPEWLFVSEAAQVLALSPGTIRRAAVRGELQGWRTPGGHWRFRYEDCVRFAREHCGVRGI